jgi:hypothetical protein
MQLAKGKRSQILVQLHQVMLFVFSIEACFNKKPSCCWDGRLTAPKQILDFHFRDLEMTLRGQPMSKVMAVSEPAGSICH